MTRFSFSKTTGFLLSTSLSLVLLSHSDVCSAGRHTKKTPHKVEVDQKKRQAQLEAELEKYKTLAKIAQAEKEKAQENFYGIQNALGIAEEKQHTDLTQSFCSNLKKVGETARKASELKRELKEAKHENKALSTENSHLKKQAQQNQELRAQIQATQQEKSELENKIKLKEAEIETAAERLKQQEKNTDLKERVAIAGASKIYDLQKELAALKAQNGDLQQTVEDQQKQLQETITQQKQQEKSLTSKLLGLQKDLTKQTQNKAKATQEINSLRSRLQSLQKDLQANEKKQKNLAKELKKKEEEKRARSAQEEELKRQVNFIEAQKDSLTKQLKTAQSSGTKDKKQLEKLQKQLQALEKKSKKEKGELKKKQAELKKDLTEKTRREKERLEKEKRALAEKAHQEKMQLLEEKKLVEQQAKIEKLNIELTAAEQRLSDLEAQRENVLKSEKKRKEDLLQLKEVATEKIKAESKKGFLRALESRSDPDIKDQLPPMEIFSEGPDNNLTEVEDKIAKVKIKIKSLQDELNKLSPEQKTSETLQATEKPSGARPISEEEATPAETPSEGRVQKKKPNLTVNTSEATGGGSSKLAEPTQPQTTDADSTTEETKSSGSWLSSWFSRG